VYEFLWMTKKQKQCIMLLKNSWFIITLQGVINDPFSFNLAGSVYGMRLNIPNRHDLIEPLLLPCGGLAFFDEASGISYRCECGAVVGSMGMPAHCKEEADKWEVQKALGGNGWDYFAEIDLNEKR
jgi:hypothetical protein